MRSPCLGVILLPVLMLAAVAGESTRTTALAGWERAGGGTPEHLLSEEDLLARYYSHVLVVEVRSLAAPGPFSNGAPPRPVLQVIRSLKGEIGERINSIWAPMPHDIDYTGGDSLARLAQWNAQPLSAPEPGSRWIIAGRLNGDSLTVSPCCRYPFSESVERKVLFVLKEAPAWFKRWEAEQAQSRADLRPADQRLELSADLERLCAASTDIVLGKPGVIEPGLGSYALLVHESEHLLDSRPPAERKDEPVVAVDGLFEAGRMIDLRSNRDPDAESRYLFFLRPAGDQTQGVIRARCDPRAFIFADPDNGMIRATPERLERVKRIVVKRAEAAARPSGVR
jgi:hypothetical protein